MSVLKSTAARLWSSMTIRSATFYHKLPFQDTPKTIRVTYPTTNNCRSRACLQCTRNISTESNLSRHVLLLRGLNFRDTEQHVIDLLKGVRVENGSKGVTFMYSESALRTGTAFVHVASKDDVATALQLNGTKTAHSYVKILDSLESSYRTTVSSSQVKPLRSLTGHTVILVKIPNLVTEEIIRDFFSPLQPVVVKFRVGRGEGGGQVWHNHKAFVDFATHEEAVKAMEKHKEMIFGGKIVSLILQSYPGVCTCYPTLPHDS